MSVLTYSVVVESGSCDPTYTRWEERAHCGHRHRTLETAERCRSRLTRMYCQHGHVAGTWCVHCLGRARSQQTSARWYHATIHDQHGRRI